MFMVVWLGMVVKCSEDKLFNSLTVSISGRRYEVEGASLYQPHVDNGGNLRLADDILLHQLPDGSVAMRVNGKWRVCYV